MAALDNVVMVGPWGRTGGAFWKHELPQVHARGTKIIIRFGTHINYITVESVENWDNIKYHPKLSGAGVDIEITALIALLPNEYITEYYFGFSEPDAKYLSWLQFTTNTDEIYGPYGTVTTSKFSLPVIKGKPVGFFGWNEAPISSIGVELAASDNVVKVGQWGLTDIGPRVISEIVVHDVVHARDTIIIINYGARINYITVESEEKSDINKDNIEHHPQRSGAVGDETIKITLGPDEFIKDYFVYVEPGSNCLSALGFTTNKNMYGPYGTVTTSVFTLPVTKDNLVGFFGNNEVPINSIGFELAP